MANQNKARDEKPIQLTDSITQTRGSLSIKGHRRTLTTAEAKEARSAQINAYRKAFSDHFLTPGEELIVPNENFFFNTKHAKKN